MRGQVTRDWTGRPCLSWTDAERLYLRMLRDREQATREQAERLAVIEQARGQYVGAGIVGAESPGAGDWRAPQVAFKELH
jgi:hypothetical protein